MCVCTLSHFATPWTAAHQALLSMGFPRQENWSGLPGPSPGDLPHPWIGPASLLSFELAGGLFTTSANWEAKEGLVNVKSLSRARLFATPGTVAYQAPLPMGFSRQEYWNGLPFPSPGDLPDPGIEPRSPAL